MSNAQHDWVFIFSLLYAHAFAQKKNMQRKNKSKKIKKKKMLYMIASVYSRRCASYRMYLEGVNLHQTVMIVCELK